MYCSQCGAELALAQIEGRQRERCPACGRVAYRQLKVGAGALIQRDGKLLLVRRGPALSAFPGTWNLPSGYCEVDESPRQAAARETREETGLEVEVGPLVDVYHFDDRRLAELGIISLPGTLEEALDELEEDEVIKTALGEHAYEAFMRAKRVEWDEYRIQVTDWELNRYLETL